jgi:hypothetical protein
MIPVYKTSSGGKSVKVNGINHNMVCNSCDKFLGILVESISEPSSLGKLAHYQCICPCGGDSFIVKSENKCFMVPDDSMYIKGQPFNIKEKYIELKIILEKS